MIALHRTAALSRLNGFMFMGVAPSYFVGGLITGRFGAAVCLWSSAGILALNLVWALFTLPETQRPETTAYAADVAAAESTPSENVQTPTIFTRVKRGLWKALMWVLGPFDTLKHLFPRKDVVDGKLNFRVTLLGLGALFYNLGNMYIGQVILLYAMTALRFNAEQVSLLVLLFSPTAMSTFVAINI